MATLQQVRLDAYVTRNAADDTQLADSVTLPPVSPFDAATVAATLLTVLDRVAAGTKLPLLVVAGTPAAALEALVAAGAPEPVAVAYTRSTNGGRSAAPALIRVAVATLSCGSGDRAVLLVAAPAVDDALPVGGPWSSPADAQHLAAVVAALAPSASCVVALDARPPPKERLTLGGGGGSDVDPDGIFVGVVAPSRPGAPAPGALPAALAPRLGGKTLAPLPVVALPPPLVLDGAPACVVTAAATAADGSPLAALPVVALRVHAPAVEAASVDVAVAAVAAALAAADAAEGRPAAPPALPAGFSAAFATALRRLRGTGGGIVPGRGSTLAA
jgi:hypothetical protein